MTDPVPARGLSPDEAAALARLLSAERDATSTRIEELTREFDSIVESAALEAPDDEHDPEGSTIGFERAQVAALIDQARSGSGSSRARFGGSATARTGRASTAATRSGWNVSRLGPGHRPASGAPPGRVVLSARDDRQSKIPEISLTTVRFVTARVGHRHGTEC